MIQSNRVRSLPRAILLTTIAVAMQGSQAQSSKIRRIELQHQDLAIPGRAVIQVRVELDVGAVFGRHKHPGDEIIYVIEGSLEYEIGGRPAIRLSVGDVLFIPSGVIHSVGNFGSETAAELATNVVEIGKPLVVMME